MSKKDDLYTTCELELTGFIEQAFPDAKQDQAHDIRMIWRAGQYIVMNQLAVRADELEQEEINEFMDNLTAHLQNHS